MEKKLQVFGSSICGFEGMYQNLISFKCASGSGVEHHLAKVGAAGSNPVSRSLKCEGILVNTGVFFFYLVLSLKTSRRHLLNFPQGSGHQVIGFFFR